LFDYVDCVDNFSLFNQNYKVSFDVLTFSHKNYHGVRVSLVERYCRLAMFRQARLIKSARRLEAASGLSGLVGLQVVEQLEVRVQHEARFGPVPGSVELPPVGPVVLGHGGILRNNNRKKIFLTIML